MARSTEAGMRGEQTRSEDPGILLGILSAVARDSRVTQRHIAQELNIALGLTNAYVKRCAKKGYIKVQQIPLHRYAYYLTPRGFAEKTRLAAEYLAVSFDLFRQARRDCKALLGECRRRGWRRLALYGAGDLAEIAVLSATEAEVEIVCIIDAQAESASCAGRPVFKELALALARDVHPAIDAIVVTDQRTPQQSFDALRKTAALYGLLPERVLAPDLLRLSPIEKVSPP
jgi:DNA-binding MarR family transcriptional regulator